MKLNKNFAFGLFLAIWTAAIYSRFVPSANHFVVLGASFLICYPWKIGKHVWSVFGGFNEGGDVYSLFGIFQSTRKHRDVVSLIGISFYQRAYGGSATQYCGISFYQEGDSVHQFCGASLIQRGDGIAEHLDAVQQGVGLAIYQSSKQGYCSQFVGLRGFVNGSVKRHSFLTIEIAGRPREAVPI